MNAIYLFSFRRRIERQWAERIKFLTQLRGQIVVATERTLQRVFNNNEGSLIPVTVRTVVDRRRPDQCRSHD
jgi:hypothetical protein